MFNVSSFGIFIVHLFKPKEMTPMQELLEKLQDIYYNDLYPSDIKEGVLLSINIIVKRGYLEKEKQAFIEAHDSGKNILPPNTKWRTIL
jgi:hypothetical protein